MDFRGIEGSKAKRGTLVVVFGKIIWTPDQALLSTLQAEGILDKFTYVARALNTKVLALPWKVPQTRDEAEAQRVALAKHKELREAHGFAMPELAKAYQDDDGKKIPFMDGGELVVAMARTAPERIGEAMPYLRLPQRQDWFMDLLSEVGDETKGAKEKALVFDAIASMTIPPASNRYRKTYVRAVGEALDAFRKSKNAEGIKRLEDKARIFAKELARMKS